MPATCAHLVPDCAARYCLDQSSPARTWPLAAADCGRQYRQDFSSTFTPGQDLKMGRQHNDDDALDIERVLLAARVASATSAAGVAAPINTSERFDDALTRGRVTPAQVTHLYQRPSSPASNSGTERVSCNRVSVNQQSGKVQQLKTIVVAEGIRCTKCRTVLRNPVQANCGHRYCSECAISLIEPHSGQGVCVGDACMTRFAVSQLHQDKQALKEVQALCLPGHSRKAGFDWEEKLSQLQVPIQSDPCTTAPRLSAEQPRSQSQMPYTQSPTSWHSLPSQHDITTSAPAADDITTELQEMRSLFSALRRHMFQQLNVHGDAITGLKQDLSQQQETSQHLMSQVRKLQDDNTALQRQLADHEKSQSDEMDAVRRELEHSQAQQQRADSSQSLLSGRNHFDFTDGTQRAENSSVYDHPNMGQHPADMTSTCRFSTTSADSGLGMDNGTERTRSVEFTASSTASQQTCVIPQSVVRNVNALESEVNDLGLRLDIMEHCTTNGHFVWKVKNYSHHVQQARASSSSHSLYSPYFFTHPQGYKMCLRMYPIGDGSGKGTHLSLFIVVMESEYDAVLTWPMNKKICFRVRDQTPVLPEHRTETFLANGNTGSSFRRPTSAMNVASGVPKMIAVDKLQPGSSYLRNDTLFLEVTVTDYKPGTRASR